MRFENNILGFVNEAEWLDVGTNVTRPNDPIDSLFGDERTDNLFARWQTIAAAYRIPVMAQFHAFDTEAKTAFRIPVDTHSIEKGLIKVKINQSERMRELLRSGIREDTLYEEVINDGIRLADQVITRTKVAKNELLATGKVTIKENGLNTTVDYGVDSSQTSLTLNVAPSADIPSQILNIVETALNNGVTLTGIVCQRSVITKMRQNTAMQKIINGSARSGAVVRNSELNDFLESEFGINRIITNDLSYGADEKIGADGRPVYTQKKYYPADKITFFASNPAGRIGVGLWGNPPEADSKINISGNSSILSPYVYISQWSEKDPAVLWTKASALFMPVLYNPSSLWIADVSVS